MVAGRNPIGGIMKSLLVERKGLVEKKTQQSRDERNKQNDEVKRWVETRKGIQDTLRKLMDEMDRQQEIREAENQKVRDLKVIREEKTKIMQSIRTELFANIDDNRKQQRNKTRGIKAIKSDMDDLEKRQMRGNITEKKFQEKRKKLIQEMKEAKESKDSFADGPSEIRQRLKKAEAEQEKAHADVDAAAIVAQSAHDLMGEIKNEVTRLREEHSDAHRKVEKFRRIADKHHRKFLVGMRCIQSVDGILNSSMDEVESEDQASSVEARDLMDLLMSGETLGLDDLMAFQRNN